MHGKIRCFTFIFVSFLSIGCAHKPQTIAINATPASSLNQDENGQSLSLLVRSYQLKTADAFKQITNDKLLSNSDDELFGSQLIERKEFVLIPGQSQKLDITIQPDTQYLALVGNFRQPETHRWRYLFSRDNALDKKITIKAQDCYLLTAGAAVVLLPGQDLVGNPECPQRLAVTATPVQTSNSVESTAKVTNKNSKKKPTPTSTSNSGTANSPSAKKE